MTDKMDWDILLKKDRFDPRPNKIPPTTHSTSPITVFQEDIRRILYSSPFRRLQGKTQVHPFPSFDYLRNRLTHTVEVAYVGRTLANQIAQELSINAQEVSDIVNAACLAHDIGNTPFGHIGEHAIQTWFVRKEDEGSLQDIFKDEEKKYDFLCFDGNAQGFRVLTKLTGWRGDGGLQLSYASLGAFSKYPFSSKICDKKKKKFGFMYDDEKHAEKIFSKNGQLFNDSKYSRHPLVYIVEAADDICYLTTDIEDAYRMKLLEFHSAEEILKEIAEIGGHCVRYNEIKNSEFQDKISYLRAGAVSSLMDEVIGVFCKHHNEILQGKFNGSLLDHSKYKTNKKTISDECKKTIYVEKNKIQLESAGFNIIMTIMDLYGEMIIRCQEKGFEKLDDRDRGLFALLPDDCKDRLVLSSNQYCAMLVLTDYVSGMTDRFILELFQKLTGSSVSLGRMLS